MKRKVCVRSMALGAVIMLVGLAIGAIVSPPLVAQRAEVFDEIECSKLTVVDKHGKPRVALTAGSSVLDSELSLYDSDGRVRVYAFASKVGHAIILAQAKSRGSKIELTVMEEGAGVYINDKHGTTGVGLQASEDGSSLTLNQNRKTGILLWAQKGENRINLFNPHAKKTIVLFSDVANNGMILADPSSEQKILVGTTDNINSIFMWDKAGNVEWAAP